MNKTNMIVKTILTGIACVALGTTALAAPHGGNRAPQKAPTHQKETIRQKAPAPQKACAPQKHHTPAPVAHHQPAHHQPAPPPPPPERHHGGHPHEPTGWAALVGGIVGGIIGACR